MVISLQDYIVMYIRGFLQWCLRGKRENIKIHSTK
jgi:hypothetical protein